jgi:hypothetical protein
MATPTVPPTGAPKPTNDLVDAVRHWVHFDNLAESLGKQVQNARTLRGDYETKVLKHLETTGMKNAVLQINGATLQRSSKSKPVDLSWTYLEEQLKVYYKTKGKADETAALLDFLQRHRTMKTQEYLKKTVTATPVAAVPPTK